MKNESLGVMLVLILLLFGMKELYSQKKTDTISYPRLSKFTIASINQYQYSNSDLKSSYLNRGVKINEFRASAQIAIPFNKGKSYIFNGWDYIKVNSLADKLTPEEFYHNQYKSITCNLGIINNFKNYWSLLFIISPSIASDFKESLSNDDFTLGISAMASKRYNEFFEYGIGFSFNTRFKYEMYLPLLSLKYKKGRHELSALLPLQLSAFYCFKYYKIGFEGRLFENYYNADNDLATNINMDKFGFSKVNFGPKIQVQLYHALHFNVATGITVFNELTSLNKRGARTEITAAKNKLFYNFGLSVLK